MLIYNDYSMQLGYHYIFKVQYMISTKRMLCLIALLTPQQKEMTSSEKTGCLLKCFLKCILFISYKFKAAYSAETDDSRLVFFSMLKTVKWRNQNILNARHWNSIDALQPWTTLQCSVVKSAKYSHEEVFSFLSASAVAPILNMKWTFWPSVHCTEMKIWKTGGETCFSEGLSFSQTGLCLSNVPADLQRSSASSPPWRSRVFQRSPGRPSAAAATSTGGDHCRRTPQLRKQTDSAKQVSLKNTEIL